MKIIVFILLIGLLTLWQAYGFSIFDIKPNLALISLIAVSFFVENIWQGLLLVALSAFILKFSPGFDSGILIFSLIGAGDILVKKFHPWQYFLGNLVLIFLSQLIFYAVLASRLILSILFVEELVLNMAIGILIFAFLWLIWQNKSNEIFLRSY